MGILALVAVILGAAYAYLDHHMDIANKSDFDKSDVTNLELSQETRDKMEEGFWTIAIFGVDSRDNSTGKGNQSDVIMIANIDRKTGEIKLVSVYRDTYLNINDRNVYNKINAAYAEGGPQQAIKAINKNLDLNITQYVTFNWKAVATGINILGGVDIEISKAEHYYINAFITETVKGTGIGSVQIKKPGMHHMDGVPGRGLRPSPSHGQRLRPYRASAPGDPEGLREGCKVRPGYLKQPCWATWRAMCRDEY